MSAPYYDPKVTPQGYGYNQGQPTVVYGQPAPTHTTVVLQQPGVGPMGRPMRDWSSGVCSCMDDCGICLCGTFCSLCLACQVAGDMNESMILPCCVYNFVTVLRTKIRTQENIQGSILNDCCMETFCGPCALCQLAREVRYVRNNALAGR